MSRIAGRLQTLDVSTDGGTTYTAIGCIVDGNFNGEGEEIDTTCHDDGVARTYIAGRAGVSMDITGLRDESDAGQASLETAFFDRITYDYRWRGQAASGIREYRAQGIVTSFSTSGPNDDAAGLDVSIRMSGAVTRATQA